MTDEKRVIPERIELSNKLRASVRDVNAAIDRFRYDPDFDHVELRDTVFDIRKYALEALYRDMMKGK